MMQSRHSSEYLESGVSDQDVIKTELNVLNSSLPPPPNKDEDSNICIIIFQTLEKMLIILFKVLKLLFSLTYTVFNCAWEKLEAHQIQRFSRNSQRIESNNKLNYDENDQPNDVTCRTCEKYCKNTRVEEDTSNDTCNYHKPKECPYKRRTNLARNVNVGKHGNCPFNKCCCTCGLVSSRIY